MGVKAAGNVDVSYAGTAIESYLNQASLEAVVAEIDVTDLASTATEKIPGLAGWSVPVGGNWAKALDDLLGPDTVTPGTLRTLVVAIGASGAVATYTFTSASFLSNYRISAEPSGAITWSGTLSVTGAPVRS